MAGEPTMVPKAAGPSLGDACTGRLKRISVTNKGSPRSLLLHVEIKIESEGKLVRDE